MNRLKTIVAGTMTLALTLGGGLLAHQQYVRAADNDTSTVQQHDDLTKSQSQNRMRGKAHGLSPTADRSAAHGQQDGKRGFPGGGRSFAFGGGVGISDELAALLGTTKEELRSTIQSGSTIASIAETKGISIDSVISLLVGSQAERLDQQVADGKLTLEQANQRKTLLTEGAIRFVNGEWNGKGGKIGQERNDRNGKAEGKARFPGGHVPAFGGGIGISDELAALLGTTKEELRSAIQSGSTIASIAETKGISIDSVISLLVGSQAERLDQQVADGKLTLEQADQRKALLTEGATRFVNGELHAKGSKDREPRDGGKGKPRIKGVFPGERSQPSAEQKA